ncbi:unnamed protein product [Caenorhabditis auriculariae]|uniref:SXP/RAL-2 family protein Ani s 5-like cation-binding domain-containing protein n=1 Tax=Caenorhabditis auriculariae TaxID=2777116 RepID=A0A8S1HHZ1_9PELO|nr:unnamed protein product [Caenorhabditis auriculariae]
MRSVLHALILVTVVVSRAPEEDSSEDVAETVAPTTLVKGANCELPAFTNLLPLHYRRELRKIWSGFITSAAAKKCERQLAQTRELVESLPEDVKVRVLEWGSTGTAPSKTSFLVGLSVEQTREFAAIMGNRSRSASERSQSLREWASVTLDLDAANQMEQFIQFLNRKQNSFELKVSKLSPEAKKAHVELENLRKMKQQVYSALSSTVKRELASLYRAKCPRGNVWDNGELDAEEIQLACSSAPEERTSIATSTTTLTPMTSSSVSPTTSQSTTSSASWGKLNVTAAPSTETTSSESTSIFLSSSAVPLIPPRPRGINNGFTSSNNASTRTFVEDPSKLTYLMRKLFPHNFII